MRNLVMLAAVAAFGAGRTAGHGRCRMGSNTGVYGVGTVRTRIAAKKLEKTMRTERIYGRRDICQIISISEVAMK
ncbi:hypothetical protein DFH09DRAFT_1135796 [Mycena vulgaris]|nr:hypothetical protein DFH09DRAFT_1135796 [Mycena vulgaris]